jgi:hypothetical protein
MFMMYVSIVCLSFEICDIMFKKWKWQRNVKIMLIRTKNETIFFRITKNILFFLHNNENIQFLCGLLIIDELSINMHHDWMANN